MRRSILGALLALLLLAPSSALGFEIVPGSTKVELLDAGGQADDRAAAHQDRVVVSFEVDESDERTLKDAVIHLPPGFGANLADFPACSRTLFFATPLSAQPDCPPESRVGAISWSSGGESFGFPFFNIEPAPNELASLGGAFLQTLAISVRMDGSQGIVLRLAELPNVRVFIHFEKVRIELWGVPAAHLEGGPYPLRPFLTTPTRCDVDPAGIIETRNWEEPDRWLETGASLGHTLTDCASIPFDPSTGVSLDDARADVATGAEVHLHVPQSTAPTARASSQVRAAKVDLPAGVTISPGAASSLETCSDVRFDEGSADAPSCPARSRVGSVALSSPALQKPASGDVYLGDERPGDRFRLLVAVSVPGSTVKFAGSLRPDKQTGRLTAALDEMPEFPFEDLDLRFDGGARAVLATPLACGQASGSVELTPYSGTGPVTRPLSVAIAPHGGGACAPPAFAPSFSGGGDDTRAGKGAAFAATISRRDGEAAPDRIEVEFPAGVSANLASVPRCGSAEAAAGACPAASRVGGAQAELGPGDNPARLDGDVFLTGPYKNAPFGVAIVFGGRIGPFDFGKTVVRGRLDMDSTTGQVSLVTDSLPRLIEGIGVRFETIALRIDRPGFMRNPTSCSPKEIAATLTSQAGTVAKASSPFRVEGCVELPFRPRFGMQLKGASEMRKGGRPSLVVSVSSPAGNANLHGAAFKLPGLMKFNAGGLRALCPRPKALDGECAKHSQVGTAKARTPLLDAPLAGPVHIVQPKGNKGTPDLWAELAGEGVEINLQIDTEEAKGRFGGELTGLPDIPLRSFAMSLASGERSLIELERGLCQGGRERRLSSPLELGGQNGALLQTRIPVKAAARCGGR